MSPVPSRVEAIAAQSSPLLSTVCALSSLLLDRPMCPIWILLFPKPKTGDYIWGQDQRRGETSTEYSG